MFRRQRVMVYMTCIVAFMITLILPPFFQIAYSMPVVQGQGVALDYIKLATQQIQSLEERLSQAKHECFDLQQQLQRDRHAENLVDSRMIDSLTNQSFIDISISKSCLDTINLELTASQQAVSNVIKEIQSIKNKLNMLSIFNLKMMHQTDTADAQLLYSQLSQQEKLLGLEKVRVRSLLRLKKIANQVLSLKQEKYHYLSELIQNKKIFAIQQQQFKQENLYQKQQSDGLQVLKRLHTLFSQARQTSQQYIEWGREIFYANEKARFIYIQLLAGRYQSQLQLMKLTRLDSIAALSDVDLQAQGLYKQIHSLTEVLNTRITNVKSYQSMLSKKHLDFPMLTEDGKLVNLNKQYQLVYSHLLQTNQELVKFRIQLNKVLQKKLSSPQRFIAFNTQAWLRLWGEVLLIPTLTFQMLKSFSTFFMQIIQTTTIWTVLFLCSIEIGIIFLFYFFKKRVLSSLHSMMVSQTESNFKWVGLRWLEHNFIDMIWISNILGVLYFLGMHISYVLFLIYLGLIWLISKGILSLARLCLVETIHDDTGRDVKLYSQLKWIVMIGSVITVLTVIVYQLPLYVYELQLLFSLLFLCFLLIVSLLLLRFWEVVPNFILSHMVSQHPYLPKTIRLLGILIPSLLLVNSIAGLFGFVSLIYIFSWYEGIFLIVLSGYLILRGFLSEAMEQLSRLMIQYVHNGWLWTEAFLKPLDKILRITLFLVAWAVLFILYGWDKQSPIVERLTRLLQYKLISVLNTVIMPINIIKLIVVISIFYWITRWTREFVYRMLAARTKDMGVRNSIAVLSQYSVIAVGIFLCLHVLGIDLRALTVVIGMFSLGIGFGLRDLANNFVCGFLILLERPLRVGDLVEIAGQQGEVSHIGSRAVIVRTGDRLELVVPNAEIFNKTIINWTAHDSIVRMVIPIKVGRPDNPHQVKSLICNVLLSDPDILSEPSPEAFLKEMNDAFIAFELRFFVNIRQIQSQISVASRLLMKIWDVFNQYNIKPPYPKHVVCLEDSSSTTLS